jgi:hypothetical protein
MGVAAEVGAAVAVARTAVGHTHLAAAEAEAGADSPLVADSTFPSPYWFPTGDHHSAPAFWLRPW